MSPTPTTGPAACSRFPRVSGDEPLHVTLEVLRLEFSPRERG